MFVCATQIVKMCPELLSILQAETFQKESELHSKQLRFWTHKLWNCTQNFFCKTCQKITCKMCVNFTANSFVFEHINRENLPRTFSVNLGGGELPKCVWTSQQTTSFLDAKIGKMRPELFSQSVQDENFQNASELHSKLLHFWTHKSWNYAQNFLCKSCRQSTLEMRLNFTAKSFVSRRTNWENAPRPFIITLTKRKLPKCVWTSQQSASFLDA